MRPTRRRSLHGTPTESPPPPRHHSNSPPQNQLRASIGRRRRRPSISGESVASAGANSISFRVDDNDALSSSSSSSSNADSNNATMDVMDLRPSHHIMETASLASFASNISLDSVLASELFRVANSGTNTTVSDNDRQGVTGQIVGGSSLQQRDLPQHWVDTLGAYDEALFPVNDTGLWQDPILARRNATADQNDSEAAYRALIDIIRNNNAASVESSDGYDFHPGLSTTIPVTTSGIGRGSMTSVASHQSSGFWSAMDDLPDSDSVMNVSLGSNSSSGGSVVSESSSSSLTRKQRRSLYVKRCARAMVVLMTLATLSCTAIYYFIADENERSSIINALPFIGKKSSASSSQEQQTDAARDLYFEQQGKWDDDEYREERSTHDGTNMKLARQMREKHDKAWEDWNKKREAVLNGGGDGVEEEEVHRRTMWTDLEQAQRKERFVQARRDQRRAQRRKQAEANAAITDTEVRDATDRRRATVVKDVAEEEYLVKGYDYHYTGEEWQQQNP